MVWPNQATPGIGSGFAGDNVHHGRLSGTVGTDNTAQFPFIHIEIQIVNGFKSVKADADPLKIQNDLVTGIQNRAECQGLKNQTHGPVARIPGRLLTVESCGLLFKPDQACNPFGKKNRYHNKKCAQGKQPGIGQGAGQVTFGPVDCQGPCNSAVQGPPAAHGHPDHNFNGVDRGKFRRVDNAHLGDIQGTGYTGNGGGKDKDPQFYVFNIVPAKPYSILGIPYGRQDPSKF